MDLAASFSHVSDTVNCCAKMRRSFGIQRSRSFIISSSGPPLTFKGSRGRFRHASA